MPTYATEDKWIDANMLAGFEAAMRSAGKTVTSHWYEAKHGFANPTTARYDEADATLARERTTAFLDCVPSASASAGLGRASRRRRDCGVRRKQDARVGEAGR